MGNRKKPTEKQDAYIDARMGGASVSEATRMAGYKDSNLQSPPERSSQIQMLLAEARRELQRATNIRKKDVINGILEAIERARMLGEPNTEIQGWKELAKIMGYYAPEVKKITLTTEEGRMRAKFEQLSDKDLLELASGNVIDADFSVVQ